MAQINLPSSSLLENADTKKLKSYLLSLTEELRYALANLDEENMSQSSYEALRIAKETGGRVEDIISRLNLKSGRSPDGGGFFSLGGISVAFGREYLPLVNPPKFIGKATSPLNIRTAPTVSSESLGLIRQYDSFEIYSFEREFALVRYGDKEGYCHTDYMTVKVNVTDQDKRGVKIPLTLSFSGDYILLLTPEGEDCSDVVCTVGEKAEDGFTVFLSSASAAAEGVYINWMAAGIRK